MKVAGGGGGWKRRWVRASGFVLFLAPLVQGGERKLVVMAEERYLDSWALLEDLTRAFETAHDVRVQLVELGGAVGSLDKTKFLLTGGLQLDVARIDVTELAAYRAEGALTDLSPHLQALPDWDPGVFFDVALDAARGEEGEIFGLPSTFTPYVLYANLDLLYAASIPRPGAGWTWEDFLEIARKTTIDEDGDGRPEQYGISLTQWLQAIVPWVWQNGGDLLDAEGRRSRMAEPEFVGAMQFLHDLLHVDRVASFDASFQNQLSQGLFQAGRVAFYGPVGYWETFRFRNIDAFRWDVVPLPRNVEAATSVAMTLYVVPRTSREPELAARFLHEVLTGTEYQRKMAEIGNGVPGLRAVAESPSFLKPDVPPENEHVFLDSMAYARFLPPIVNWYKVESLTAAERSDILLVPDCDVPAACERMAEKTDAFLERERRRTSRTPAPRHLFEIALSVSILVLLTGFVLTRGRKPSTPFAREERHGYAMVSLWAAGFLLFLFGPAVVTLVLSICEWSPLRDLTEVRLVGLDNYRRLVTDPTFHTSLGATALYAVLSVPLGLVLALALAVLLQSDSDTARAVRTVVYLPAVISPVIIAATWRYVLDGERGPVNGFLRALGLDPPLWLQSPSWVVPAFVLVSLWSVGAQMLVFLAALKAQDRSLLEAARIDGAGAWRRFLHVTLPGLTPVVLFNLVTGTIAAFQVFAQPYVMTEGGPGDASRFLVLYLYESGFRHLDMGYASAIAWVLFVLLAVLCLLVMGTSRRWVHYAGRSRT